MKTQHALVGPAIILGVLAVTLTPSEWQDDLFVCAYAAGSPGVALPADATVYVTVFRGGWMPDGFTAVP